MRINKYLSTAGIASRRKVEEFILKGQVKVNGKVVKDLSCDIKDTDIVYFNNNIVRVSQNFDYYKLHKPKGYVTTSSDDKDRKTVMDLMRGVHSRVFPVGRLDYETEGLLIMTNDGEITNILTKPSSDVEKIYMVHIDSGITKDEIKKLSLGVDIGGYTTKPCRVLPIEVKDDFSKIEITISEGKNRQVRKMMEAVGKNVTLLRRIQIGEIRLGGLSRGEYTKLNQKEINYLKSLKKK
ncbi:MAG: rRNA pseudouridine synthase [Clostridiales bacterium]|nr:rRNA pseudouridine synthase [Clostridiales bacterium]